MCNFEEINDERDFKIAVENILGLVDAELEWDSNKDGVYTNNRFIYTDSYTNFKDTNILYLYGLRGSGKTSVIRMYNYEINKKKNDIFKYSTIIDKGNAYHELETYIYRDALEGAELNHRYLVSLLKEQWLWVIKVSAMVELIKKDFIICKDDDNFKLIHKYLSTEGLISQDSNPIKILKYILDNKGINTPKEIELIDYLHIKSRRYENKLFKDAEDSLINILRERGSCLVMIDSLEFYEFRNTVFSAIVSGLVEAIYDIYGEFLNGNGILAKAVFPSEIKS
jgi:energy-coupling factor transporter ATP-binding protein EcfA2